MDEIFKKLRFDESHHIGLGDIRLTIAQQHELAVIYNKLKQENTKLLATMKLHAGDCCSLSNEVDMFKDHWDEAEERNTALLEENAKLKEYIGRLEETVEGVGP